MRLNSKIFNTRPDGPNRKIKMADFQLLKFPGFNFGFIAHIVLSSMPVMKIFIIFLVLTGVFKV